MRQLLKTLPLLLAFAGLVPTIALACPAHDHCGDGCQKVEGECVCELRTPA